MNAGNILYEHEMSPEPFWEAHDTIGLLLSSPPARDVAATLAVVVSFDAACPQRPSRLWRNKGEQHDGMVKLRVQKTASNRGLEAWLAAPVLVPGPQKVWG